MPQTFKSQHIRGYIQTAKRGTQMETRRSHCHSLPVKQMHSVFSSFPSHQTPTSNHSCHSCHLTLPFTCFSISLISVPVFIPSPAPGQNVTSETETVLNSVNLCQPFHLQPEPVPDSPFPAAGLTPMADVVHGED